MHLSATKASTSIFLYSQCLYYVGTGDKTDQSGKNNHFSIIFIPKNESKMCTQASNLPLQKTTIEKGIPTTALFPIKHNPQGRGFWAIIR